MKKITIEITKEQGDLVMPNYPHQLYASNEKSNRKYDLEILDVDKFREFLNDEMFHHFQDFKTMADNEIKNLKSILSKLDEAV